MIGRGEVPPGGGLRSSGSFLFGRWRPAILIEILGPGFREGGNKGGAEPAPPVRSQSSDLDRTVRECQYASELMTSPPLRVASIWYTWGRAVPNVVLAAAREAVDEAYGVARSPNYTGPNLRSTP